MHEEITEWHYQRGRAVHTREGVNKKHLKDSSRRYKYVRAGGEGKEYVALSKKLVRASLFEENNE